jgi:phosphatidate cytidylyltransferase
LPLLGLLIAFASPAVFSLFMSLVLFFGLFEFNRMGLAGEQRAVQMLAALAGAMIVPLLYCQQTALLLPLLAATFLLLALLFLWCLPPIDDFSRRFGWLCLGLLYLPLLLGHLIPLRLLPDGREWIFLTLMVIMGCDTFAYFIGSKFGKRKLYPAVSPNKSFEGGIGGLFGSVLAVLLARAIFLPAVGIVDGVLIGLLLGVIGQLGDLFESLLKRACKVKDSGTMIPGHGGILDRLDSLLFAFPIVYYIARYAYGG